MTWTAIVHAPRPGASGEADMSDIRYMGPEGSKTTIDVEELRRKILDPDAAYWDSGGGGLNIWRQESSSERPVRLDVVFAAGHGFYLCYGELEPAPEREWVSLVDRERLTELVDIGDGCFASAGLFVTPDVAWDAIADFLRTGERSARARWIEPKDLPPEANW